MARTTKTAAARANQAKGTKTPTKGATKTTTAKAEKVTLPQTTQTKREVMTDAQALAAAQKSFGKHIRRVTETGARGQATRIEIECTDPQTVQREGKQVSVCQKVREIAIQDAFQVVRCVACQQRVERRKRQDKRRAKTKAARAARAAR